MVDVQVGVMEGTWNAVEVLNNIAKVVEEARANRVPVVWIQHDDDELVQGSSEWKIVPSLVPLGEEQILPKKFNSAFEDTSLQQVLEGHGATHIVLAGAATNWCIRATAYGALERGYDLTLVKDAHTTEDIDMGDGTPILARDIVSELNVVMNWVSYRDRNNSVAAASEVEFKSAAT
ncbi:MAG: isochorismatase family protein [Leptolyngbyaceae cyanobacterium SU_3_3]|nr:isochorismatase family protein [Leptolyngbyaceae cyanobacterium SU_3_3]